MSRRTGLVSLLLAGTVLAVGCGSVARQATPADPAQPPSLSTSLVTAAGTWAVAVMGGPAAEHDNFWQLFLRPAGSDRWRLATPPGVASNGGLVVASPGGRSVVAAFRPSQELSYSPLATTDDNGTAWTPGLLDATLADVPDALAASAAGRRCAPRSLTAVAFSPAGAPVLAAGCARPGTIGVFAYAGGAWHLAGPALPPSYARQNITVLRLTTTAGTTTAGTTMALLAAGTGAGARLLAAWSTGGGGHWGLSPPLPLHGAKLTSASFGPGGSVAAVLTGSQAQAITGPGGSWRQLPALPPGTATLAPGTTGGWDALAVHRTRLTIWQLPPGHTAWAATQTISVFIQFGSSG